MDAGPVNVDPLLVIRGRCDRGRGINQLDEDPQVGVAGAWRCTDKEIRRPGPFVTQLSRPTQGLAAGDYDVPADMSQRAPRDDLLGGTAAPPTLEIRSKT